MNVAVAESIVTTERLATEKAWQFLRGSTHLDAQLGEWEYTVIDGRPLLSAQLEGPDAGVSVLRFAEVGHVAGLGGVFQRMHLDYTMPGRTACVWQSNEVWVELWAPDTPAVPDAPAQAVSQPVTAPSIPGPRRVLRPSARLPFTRRKKETPTA